MIAGSIERVDPKPKLTQKAAAEKLGVTKFWLNRVLRGHDKSIRLMRRYRELLSQYQAGDNSKAA